MRCLVDDHSCSAPTASHRHASWPGGCGNCSLNRNARMRDSPCEPQQVAATSAATRLLRFTARPNTLFGLRFQRESALRFARPERNRVGDGLRGRVCRRGRSRRFTPRADPPHRPRTTGHRCWRGPRGARDAEIVSVAGRRAGRATPSGRPQASRRHPRHTPRNPRPWLPEHLCPGARGSTVWGERDPAGSWRAAPPPLRAGPPRRRARGTHPGHRDARPSPALAKRGRGRCGV